MCPVGYWLALAIGSGLADSQSLSILNVSQCLHQSLNETHTASIQSLTRCVATHTHLLLSYTRTRQRGRSAVSKEHVELIAFIILVGCAMNIINYLAFFECLASGIPSNVRRVPPPPEDRTPPVPVRRSLPSCAQLRPQPADSEDCPGRSCGWPK